MLKNQPPRTWSLVLSLGLPLTIVGGSAMAISYATLIDVARVNGLPLPELFPILVDVGTVASMIAAAQFRLRGLSGRWLAYSTFIALSAVSIVANSTHAWRSADMTVTTSWAAALLAATPPAALLAITHLVMMLVPDEKERAKLQAIKEKEHARQQLVTPAATPVRSTMLAVPATAAEVQSTPHAVVAQGHPEPLRLVGDTQPVPSIAAGKDIVRRRVLEHWEAEGVKPTGALVGEWLGGKSAKTGQRLLAEMETDGVFVEAATERSLVIGS